MPKDPLKNWKRELLSSADFFGYSAGEKSAVIANQTEFNAIKMDFSGLLRDFSKQHFGAAKLPPIIKEALIEACKDGFITKSRELNWTVIKEPKNMVYQLRKKAKR